jgi:hypothetical protein
MIEGWVTTTRPGRRLGHGRGVHWVITRVPFEAWVTSPTMVWTGRVDVQN